MAFQLDKFLIAFIVFSLIVFAGTLILNDVENNYSDFNVNLTDENYNDTYNKIDEMYSLSEEMHNDTVRGEIDEEDTLESAVKGSYKAIRMTKDTFTVSNTIMRDVAEDLHIPPAFVHIAITTLMILLVFAIIYLVLRFRPW